MKYHKIWKFITENEGTDRIKAVLICVVHHYGSSPGKTGFKMAIVHTKNKYKHIGTIGGGIMEFNLIKEAEKIIKKQEDKVIFRELLHSKNNENNKKIVDDNINNTKVASGLVCAGGQTVAIVPVTNSDIVKRIFDAYFKHQPLTIKISKQGLSLIKKSNKHRYSFESKEYYEQIGRPVFDIALLFGGGHVGFATSKFLNELGFYTILIENRELDIIQKNTMVQEKWIQKYHKSVENIFKAIKNNTLDLTKLYFIIVSSNLNYDSEILKAIIQNISRDQLRKLKYIGLMGSKNKLKQIYQDIEDSEIKKQLIAKLHAPIGLISHNNTVEEIGLSIVAEMVKEKNKRE